MDKDEDVSVAYCVCVLERYVYRSRKLTTLEYVLSSGEYV